MLERSIFMMPLVCVGQCLMQRLLETRRKCWHVRSSLLFHNTLQRMLVLPGKIHNLANLRFGDFVCKYTALADTVVVDGKHDAGGTLTILLEETLKNMDHKFHGRIVVI